MSSRPVSNPELSDRRHRRSSTAHHRNVVSYFCHGCETKIAKISENKMKLKVSVERNQSWLFGPPREKGGQCHFSFFGAKPEIL